LDFFDARWLWALKKSSIQVWLSPFHNLSFPPFKVNQFATSADKISFWVQICYGQDGREQNGRGISLERPHSSRFF
jgi:hypothetical protein